MPATHLTPTAPRLRKHDRLTATDLSWIDGLTLDQQSDELYAEMMRVVAIDDLHSDYAEAVKALRLAAIDERFERIAQERLSRR